MDSVAILDFPELDQWESVSLLYGLTAPIKLQLELAQALNEAYAIVQPLEHLLRRHRLLALSHAPLAGRLAVMRELAAKDPGNAAWATDIREMEKSRYREIAQALNGTNGDRDAVQEVLREYRESRWLSPPPKGVVQAVDRGTQQEHRWTLESLGMQLRDAVAVQDFDRAKTLADSWTKQARMIGVAVDDPLWQQSQAGLEWITTEEGSRADAASLQSALSRFDKALGASPVVSKEEVDRYYGGLSRYGAAVPADVHARYDAFLANRGKAQRARKVRWIAGVAGGVFLLVVVSVLVAWRVGKAGRITDVATTLTSLLDGHRFTEARVYLDRLVESDPATAAEPQVLQLRDRLQADTTEEQERMRRFQSTITQARTADLDLDEPPALAEARGLARLPDEKAALASLEESRQAQRLRARATREEEFAGRLRSLSAEAARLEGTLAGMPPDAAMAERLLKQLEGDLAPLQQSAPRAGDGAGEGLKTLTARVDKARKILEELARTVQYETDLTSALSLGIADYGKFLDRFQKDFPGSERALAFAHVMPEAKMWQAICDWEQLMAPLAARPLDLSLDQAKALAAKIKALLEACPAHPEGVKAQEYLQYLEAMAQQDEADHNSAAARLRELFTGPLIGNLWALKTQDGEMYYVKGNVVAALETARHQAQTYLDVHMVERLDGSDRPIKLRVARIEVAMRAPQSAVADMVKELPRNFAGPNWEVTTLGIARWILEQKDMDPIPRLLLLRQAVELASRGSQPLSMALAPHREALAKAEIGAAVIWPDPTVNASAARASAQEGLKGLPEFKGVMQTVKAQRQRIEAMLATTHYEPLGWLVQEAPNRWGCRLTKPLAGYDVLWVAMPSAGGRAEWRRVGEVRGGVAVIEPTVTGGAAQGRVVFGLKPAKR